MTGQSSLKGRGSAVLVGVPRAVKVTPEPTAIPDEAEAPELEPLSTGGAELKAAVAPVAEPAVLIDAELEAALYEEARAAEPPPPEEHPAWGAAGDWPPTPEMELALLQQSRVVQGSATPAASAAYPSATKDTTENEGDAAPVTAAPPTPGTEASMEEEISDWDIQTPQEEVEPYEEPESPLTDDQKALGAGAQSARFQQLDEEIGQVYAQVLEQVSDNEAIATECYNALLKARDIVLRRDASRLAQAEYHVEQARARLRRAAASAVGARRNAWWIFSWGFLWGMVFVALLVLLESSYVRDAIALLNLESTFVDPSVLLPAMVWGGIGGVVAIWYSLFKHVAQRDFDGHYNISYIGKPFFGLVLGATVYMLIHLLVVSLGVWQPGAAEGGTVTPGLAPWMIYLMAWVSGFKENRIFGLVEQVMKRLFPGE